MMGVPSSSPTARSSVAARIFYRLVLAHLCFLHLASSQINGTRLYVATFSMNGASGDISFSEVGSDPDITIGVNLVGLESGNYTLAIHEKPMVYGQQPSCDDALIGGVFAHGGDLIAVGNTVAVPASGNWNASYANQVISLVGPRSIMGRTLVLQKQMSNTKYCARIANSRKSITAVARFDEPFAGSVTFRQERDDPEAVTSIFVQLYDVTDPLVQANMSWRISSNTYNHDMDLSTRCIQTNSDVYNPTNVDAMNCQRGDPLTCPIGHMTGKFGDVTVEPVPSSTTYYFIDTKLPLSGGISVLGKSLVFGQVDGSPIACSPILELKPKSLKALFSVRNVSGTIHFSQDSPYDATEVRVNLVNLRGLAGGYHVHTLPPPPRTYTYDKPAGAQNVAGHFNPFGIGTSPPPGTGTNDQYEIGDLSGKFGFLTGYDNFNATYRDWNLPMFGKNSIIGRSIVIHKTEGDRWIHAAIVYPTRKKTVRALFHYPSIGQIVMSQEIGDPYADTTIYVEMAYADGTATTSGHNWHVHQSTLSNDYISANRRCVSGEGHFNPFGVDLGASYTQCSPDFPQRCEVGDLSRKHRKMTITGAMNMGAGKFFFTDTRLPLSGAYSVVGRSIVIHRADGAGPRMSCANLLEIPPTTTTANIWSSGPVSGVMTFKQDTLFDPVQIHVNIRGLNELAGGWHVHVLPVGGSKADSAPCGPESVRGHYNPFGVIGSPSYGTQDMYEMGDLSGKFGSLAGVSDSVDGVYYDTNLALSGPRSIIGRSLVVHKSADGSRWVCATLYRQTNEGDFVVRAKAEITSSDYKGYLKLSQTRYHTGAWGDTTVEISLTSNAAERGTAYWNFRPGNLDKDRCLASANLFNPHQVTMDTQDYGSQCDTKHQLRCAVGDLTGKHGNLSSTLQRAIYTDVNLPLFGQASVLGLPLHLTSTKTGQLACSTLEPHKNTGRVEYLSYPSTTTFDPYEFRKTMYESVDSAAMWQIVASQEPQASPKTGCMELTFYFIGENVNEMDLEFQQRLSNDDLGVYSPTDLCQKETGAIGGSAGLAPVGYSVFTVILVHATILHLARSP